RQPTADRARPHDLRTPARPGEGLMARPPAAARRYAEAAFQLASRDDALDPWSAGLKLAAALAADERVVAAVDNPARPYRERLAILEKPPGGRVPEGALRLAALPDEPRRTDGHPQ